MFNPFYSAWILAKFFASYWWIYAPILSLVIFEQIWTFYVGGLFEVKHKKVLLEIRIPREIRKSPKAMEQFLANIYNTKSGRGLIEKYWNGKHVLKFSLEVASLGGEVRFYIRTPERYRNIVEANLYAQYADVEIVEADDYTLEFSDSLEQIYSRGYNLWGTEIVLGKSDVYPIRSYTQFESIDEEKALDPVSALLEVLTKFKPAERMWVQILIVPADSDWKDEAKEVISRMKEESLAGGKLDEREGPMGIPMSFLSPGEREVMELIEQNVAKVGFHTMIRSIYLAPKDIFNIDLPKKGILGAFNQYGTQNLNYFRNNRDKKTDEFLYLFRKRRIEGRKKKLLADYITRNMIASNFMENFMLSSPFHLTFTAVSFVLNVEELATIYHLPTSLVLTAPMIRRVEAKKIGPPAGLPIFGGEDDTFPEMK